MNNQQKANHMDNQQKANNMNNQQKANNMNNANNAMMHLELYKENGTWKFDDSRNNIVAEPFVMGMSEIITAFVPERATCNIIFSRSTFPGCKELRLDYEEANGGWYTEPSTGMRGWLCPVTRVYYGNIPAMIYFSVN